MHSKAVSPVVTLALLVGSGLSGSCKNKPASTDKRMADTGASIAGCSQLTDQLCKVLKKVAPALDCPRPLDGWTPEDCEKEQEHLPVVVAALSEKRRAWIVTSGALLTLTPPSAYHKKTIVGDFAVPISNACTDLIQSLVRLKSRATRDIRNRIASKTVASGDAVVANDCFACQKKLVELAKGESTSPLTTDCWGTL